MEIYMYKRSYNKKSKEVKNAIVDSISMLYDKIRAYEKQGITFDKIFNDDKIKYDKHGQFFIFKCQKNNMQLRILYSYFEYNGNHIILIADYFIKKKNNKDYISHFDYINDCNPIAIYSQSFCIGEISETKAE